LLPAQIWHQIMTVAHDGKAPLSLPGLELVPAPPGPADQIVQLSDAPAVRSELLPWDMPEPPVRRADKAKPAATAAKPVPAAKPAYPSERIEEDFIARILSEDAAREAQSAPEPAGGMKRIVVRPPSGMMSLGAGADNSQELPPAP
jgi:hypothetical protein